MAAYYNEFDPFAAAWLRELIKEGLIADGEVDERSIADVQANDISGFRQVHFFAGIGGWSYALRLAGINDDEPVWTGSCPCQPFSSAGKRKCTADERHLWPEMFRLISECRPTTVFGEQVASKDGRDWLSGVFADLETMGYAGAGADLCAAGVQAPHIRQRLYWVADSNSERFHKASSDRQHCDQCDAESCGHEIAVGRTCNSASEGPQRQWSEYSPSGERSRGLVGLAMQVGVPEWNGSTIGLKCSDGTRRASAEPESFPLAYGVPNRVGTLRGAGNAIVPQVAAEFIQAYYEIKGV